MANPSSYLHTVTSRPRSDRVEVPSQSDSDDGILSQSEYQPDVNHAESYHGVDYDYEHWVQYYCDNAPYQGPPPSAVVGYWIRVSAYPPWLTRAVPKNLGGPMGGQPELDGPRDGQSYGFIRNPGPNTDYPPSGNDQDNLAPNAVYHSPPAHDDHAPLMLDFANSFSQSVPDSLPSGTLAMESLQRLVDRYLHDPGSRMDTLRMGLSPSGGRLRVTIMFDIDV
ncbi:hypothetical protein H4582DRAFT_1977582 [Lactarius indigo]|nr:hypothetical protein H4582DRAFT_1977582 [Lactarius indigo]